MLAHAPVLLVDDEGLFSVLGHDGLAVVWDEDGDGAAEEGEHVNVGIDPSLLVGSVGSLGIKVVGMGQTACEHVDLQQLARVRICRLGRIADPVDLHGLGRLVLDPHADVVGLRPCFVLLQKAECM